MIKVGIIGADTTAAGELLRLISIHPEVEIKSLIAPAWNSRPVASRHHGFIGEKIVNFSDNDIPDEVDIVFIADADKSLDRFINNVKDKPEIKIIDLRNDQDLTLLRLNNFEIGLSEINRKKLVRGATKAYIPSSSEVLSLIALFPLALNFILPSEIKIEIAAPTDVIESINCQEVSKRISQVLKDIQTNFDGIIKLNTEPNSSRRVMRMKINFKCALPLEEILKIYDSIYDDHNFVYTTLSEVEGKEIEGTHKTVITVSKPFPDELELEIVGDCRLRGGAGDAVHVMNLFFALYEKTGLQLKPSRYGQSFISTSRPDSWLG